MNTDLAAIARWVFETCLLFGAQAHTASYVAGHFVEGLKREWEREETL
jgi:hypothetical protein